MKKQIFTLLTLLVTCVTGAWATTELVYSGATGSSTSKTTYTSATGLTFVQSNNKDLATGKNITVDASTYTSFKLSTGSKNFTVTAPAGNEITAITIYSYENNATPDGGAYTIESGTEISNTAGTVFTKGSNDNATPDIQKFVFVPASSIQFSWTGKQNCCVLKVEYFSTSTSKVAISTASNPAAGSSSISAARNYYIGSTAYLKTVAADGYIFNNWTVGGDEVATSAEVFVTTPSSATTYTANFSEGTSYTITGAIADGQSTWGSITNSGENIVVEDETITFAATANTGYCFVKWQKNGNDYSTDASITVTSTANATYTAFFKQLYYVTFSVPAANRGTANTGFETQYASSTDKWSAPVNYYSASEGKTLTAWKDAETNTYTPGTEYTLTKNITIEPVFTSNAAYLSDLTAETTVTWTFARSAGAPALASENNTQYYVQRTLVAENTVDVPLFVNTVQDYGISSKKGKFNNSGNEDYAQVNNGTVFQIPAVKGMLVRYSTNQTSAVGNIGFTDDTDDLGGDGSSLTHPTVISADNKTISYTYTGTADYLYLVDIKGGKYPTGIEVTYPEKQTKYLAPTITVGDFSFATHGYPVTITASEGTLEVSTDGENYTAQTSPYEVNVTATTHFYAKATGASYDDSDVVDENVINTFDGAKSYVAWVYESNYANAPNNYNVANDEIYKALSAAYNVLLIDIKDYKSAITDEQKTALNGNLDDADLVVISEAVKGDGKGTIALKDLVGTVPMLNMKLYAYSDGRWAWATPDNKGKNTADVIITPVSKFYKVLNGVTFDGDNVALFDYPNEQNHIQYVKSWTSEPTGDVVLANVTIEETDKPAMHASNTLKYFALGLSCDDFTKYNANAIAIVKNAAAMLIAGEDLDAEMTAVTATVGANGYTTFACSYPLDLTNANRPEGLKAYQATLTGATVAFTPINQTVPAGTGLLLMGETKGGSYDIPVAASGDAISTAFTGVVAPTAMQSVADNTYYFVMKKAASAESPLEFAPLSTSKLVTIPAGKAYITVANSAFETPARELSFTFDDGETTGISDVRSKTSDVRGEYFDLQGRRIAQPTKGLYIVNGRKVVIK